MSEPVLYLFEVSNPDYPTIEVPSIGPDSALYAAIDQWGADWKRDAAYCTVRRGGKAARPRCSRCGKEFGRPGQAAGKCPNCLRADEIHRRQMAELPKADRRAGMRGVGP